MGAARRAPLARAAADGGGVEVSLGKVRKPAERAPRRDGKLGVFLRRVAQVLDVSPQEVSALLSRRPRSSLRVNRLVVREVDDTLDELRDLGVELEPIAWCPDAYFFSGTTHDLAETQLFRSGRIYIQNASSLVPVLALDPRRGDVILDACAAPGGKAAHIAALVGNDCELWLNDAIKPRVNRLREVAESFHVRYANLTQHAAQHLDKYIDRRFDRILLDAQCSGEARANLRHRDALRHWSLERVRRYGFLQRRMLAAAFKLLKPGGTLVYSTCTFGPEENEDPVDHLLRHRPDARIQPIRVAVDGMQQGLSSWERRSYDPGLRLALRIRPSERMEGFFVAKLMKAED